MRRILVLLCEVYPFGLGEPFLHEEVIALSNRFDSIKIFSFDSLNEQGVRSIPGNVECVKVPELSINYTDLMQGYRTWLTEFFDLMRNGKLSVFRAKVLLMEWLRAQACSRFIAAHLDSSKESDLPVVYSYWNSTRAVAAILYKLNRNRNCVVVSRAHRWDLYEEENPSSYLPLRRYILKNIDSLFSISNDGCKYLSGRYSEAAEKVRLSYLGVKEIRSDLRRKGSKLSFLSLSFVSQVKRLDFLARSLVKADIHVSWTHIGGGNTQIIEKLKQIVSGTKVKFTFLGGMQNSEVHHLLKGDDFNFLVNVSSSEGLPVSMMECMAASIPVIGTNVGGVGEIINHQVNGFLLDADISENEFATLLRDVAALDDEQYQSLSKEAFHTWKHRFNSSRSFEAFADDLLDLVPSR